MPHTCTDDDTVHNRGTLGNRSKKIDHNYTVNVLHVYHIDVDVILII